METKGPQYTLPQKKRNFNFQIFNGDPGPGSVTPGHVLQGEFGPKFTDLHSSPKERQLQKSCGSFGEECSMFYFKEGLNILYWSNQN